MGQNIYGDFQSAYLHKIAAHRLKSALLNLQKHYPGYGFLIFDALRPLSAQKKLWDWVKGTPQQDYIADPSKRSLHNFGMAVDLTVFNSAGVELDMGTAFDSFQELAQPQLEERFLHEGLLTKNQISNRLILRHAMQEAGFLQLPHEWWHYNALPAEEIRAKFNLIL